MTETAQGLARARTMLDLKRHDEAAALLAGIVAADPGNGTAWCLLTLAHLGTGRNADAAAAAERAAAAAPAHDWPYRLASIAQLRLGNAPAALRAADEARRLAPQEWQCHLCVAQATLATGENFDHAEESAAKARELAPHEPDVYLISGKVSLARGKRGEARAYQERALTLDPEHVGAMNELGRIRMWPLGGAAAAHYFVQAARAAPRETVYSRNVDVAVRRTVISVIYIGSVAMLAVIYLAVESHLSRAQLMLGLGAALAIAGAAGASQYLRMPAKARPLMRRGPSLLALGVGYGAVLAAAVIMALSPTSALPTAAVGIIALLLAARLAAHWMLRRKPERATAAKRG
jgi:tetratricopeptide (TPR) repeat protein